MNNKLEEIITDTELIEILGLEEDNYHLLEEDGISVCIGIWVRLAPNNWIWVGDEDE